VATAPCDSALRPTGDRGAALQDDAGLRALVTRLQALAPPRLGLAATGGDQRAVVAARATAGRSIAVGTPRQARAFAKAPGPRATTAVLDARALAHVAAAERPPPRPRPEAHTEALRALWARRRQLIAPLRVFLGWFALIPDKVPPLSLTLAYWMVGAFLIAMKRFAEYRHIGNREVAAQYRKSFRYYTENRPLVGLLFYATLCALFSGIFIARYHVELILFVPVAAGFFAYYLYLRLQNNSPVQNPEQLYKERGFLLYMTLSVTLFVLLMFTRIPFLYDLFNIELSPLTPLWTIGTLPGP
jgi:hypothetical protein